MTYETLREYTFRKEVERCLRAGVEPPHKMLGAPVGRLKDAINSFFDRFEEHRTGQADDFDNFSDDQYGQREQPREIPQVHHAHAEKAPQTKAVSPGLVTPRDFADRTRTLPTNFTGWRTSSAFAHWTSRRWRWGG